MRGRFDDEFRALSFFDVHTNAAAVRLNDLIDDREAQARALRETRIETARRCAWLRRIDARLPYRGWKRAAIRIRLQATERTPPSGMARTALLSKFQKTCFMRSRSTRARAAGVPKWRIHL